jgi:phage gpG-like protein
VSGVRLELTVDDGGLGRALERAIAAGADLKPALEASAQVLETNISLRFDQGHGPGGIPWPISRRAAEEGGKTMIKSGSLRESITHETRETEVEVGSAANAPGDVRHYAATHQYGAHITPKKGEFLIFPGAGGHLVFVRSVDIPARPFIGFDDQDVADLEDLWTDVVREAFDGN